jgi:hypothetical protein
MRSLAPAQVLGLRMQRCLLARPVVASPAGVAARIGCVQAQVPAAAEVGIGIRSAGATRDSVRHALCEGRSLVRTYAMRKTVHLVPSDELPLWMAAIRAATDWRSETWYQRRELDADRTHRFLAAVHDALDGQSLTRQELATEVAARAGPWAHGRLTSQWADLIDVACYAGAACYVPSETARVRFARPDQWLGGWHEPDEDAALLAVFRRFLALYGPARPRDFAIWMAGSRMSPKRVAALIDALGDEVERVTVDGQRGLMLSTDVDAASACDPEPSVCLLPQYDAYLLGCRLGREWVVPPAFRDLVLAVRGYYHEGPVQHQVVLVDGVARGLWEWAKDEPGRIIVHLLTPLTHDERRQLDQAIGRMGEFFGVEPLVDLVD